MEEMCRVYYKARWGPAVLRAEQMVLEAVAMEAVVAPPVIAAVSVVMDSDSG